MIKFYSHHRYVCMLYQECNFLLICTILRHRKYGMFICGLYAQLICSFQWGSFLYHLLKIVSSLMLSICELLPLNILFWNDFSFFLLCIVMVWLRKGLNISTILLRLSVTCRPHFFVGICWVLILLLKLVSATDSGKLVYC